MTDCDLCGVGIPTVAPVRVFKPKYAHSYPNGMWQGLCEPCLDSANKVNEEIAGASCGTAGKCVLCGAIAQLFDVDIKRPSFSKGEDEDTVQLCKKCLSSIGEAHERWDDEKAEEEHEHIKY